MIIFTMAGNGRRFFEAGYREIKYKLLLDGMSILFWCLKPFSPMSAYKPIILAYNPVHTNSNWIIEQCRLAGLCMRNVVLLANEDATLGQAHTAALALRRSFAKDNIKFAITNIDTVYKPTVDFNRIYKNNSSFVLCSQLNGDHWSFVKTDGDRRLTEIVEKRRISKLCTTGYYQFSSSSTYLQYFDRIMEQRRTDDTNEIFVSDVYREMLREHEIRVGEIYHKEVVLCGTPAEYESAQNEY